MDEKKNKILQKCIEKKRMKFEKQCTMWLFRMMNDVRDVVDELSCEDYTSASGQQLDEIANSLEQAYAYAADMITCMLRAETANQKVRTDGCL